MPVTTLADGTALVVINPTCPFVPAIYAANGKYLPFVSVAAGSTLNPFVTTPSFTASPFISQAGNTSTYGLDSCLI